MINLFLFLAVFFLEGPLCLEDGEAAPEEALRFEEPEPLEALFFVPVFFIVSFAIIHPFYACQ
jgi:hypothetical protein